MVRGGDSDRWWEVEILIDGGGGDSDRWWEVGILINGGRWGF